MPSVYRVRSLWSGFQGSPGYTNLHFLDLTTDAARNAAGAATKAFFTAIANNLITTWSVSVQSEVTEWDQATGQLLGAVNMTTPPTPQAGTAAAGPFAGGSGACVTWKTGSIYNGRRVIGRTFLVPLFNCFDSDGTLNSTAITAITTAATGLIGASGAELAVWAKTFVQQGDPPKPVQIGGQAFPVTSHVVKDMASQLRSRRI